MLTLASATVMPAAAPESPRAWLYGAWQTDDGLPNNNVTWIAQDRDGAMLFATLGGLARFDGWRLREIADRDHPARGVNGICRASGGGRWRVEGGRLVAPDGTALPIPGTIPEARLTTLFEARDGAVWLAYDSGNVLRVEAHRLVAVPSGTVSALAADTTGTIWARAPASWRAGTAENFPRSPACPRTRPACALRRPAASGSAAGARCGGSRKIPA